MIVHAPTPNVDHTVAVTLGPRSYNIRVVANDPAEFGPFARGELARTWAGASCRSALIVTDRNIADLGIPARIQASLSDVGIAALIAIIAGGRSDEIARAGIAALRRAGAAPGRSPYADCRAWGGRDRRPRRLCGGDVRTRASAHHGADDPARPGRQLGRRQGRDQSSRCQEYHRRVLSAGRRVDRHRNLGTLPARELRCGLAEVVKYGVILDAEFFASSGARSSRTSWGETMVPCGESSSRAAEIKAARRGPRRARRDRAAGRPQFRPYDRPRHRGGRRLRRSLPAWRGRRRGDGRRGPARGTPGLDRDRRRHRSPDPVARAIRLADVGPRTSTAGRLVAAMGRDKKNRQGKIRFVLPRAIGKVELTDAAGLDDVRAVLSASSNLNVDLHPSSPSKRVVARTGAETWPNQTPINDCST